MLVYDKDGFKGLSGEHTCKLMMETLVMLMKQRRFHYSAFDTEKASAQGMKEHLRTEVGNDFSGESLEPSHCPPVRWHKVAGLRTF